jgi:hypothetical protein
MSTRCPSPGSAAVAGALNVAWPGGTSPEEGFGQEGPAEVDVDCQSRQSMSHGHRTAAAASPSGVPLEPIASSLRRSAPASFRWAPRRVTMLLAFLQPAISTRRPVSLPIALSRVRIREIAEADKDAVALLLAAEFPRSKKTTWLVFFEKLAKHQAPAGLPQYGYFMESHGAAVAAILMIASSVRSEDVSTTRCNLSCWCVAPAYRCLAHSFMTRVLNKHDLTYVNISPAHHTLPLIQMQGFSQYCAGQFYAFTAPFIFSRRARVEIARAGVPPRARFEMFEYDLLETHAESGCISVWCVASDRAHPFVFRSRLLGGIVPYVQLIYCRSIDEFAFFYRPIARFLAGRGKLFVMMDSHGRVPGVVGIYRKGRFPRFFRGPMRPRIGDLAYTELALFGI